MPLFRRSRNQRGSDDAVNAQVFVVAPAQDASWSDRKSLDVRNTNKKRRPRLFTLGNDDRPRTATGATSNASFVMPQSRKASWTPPLPPKDDVPSLVGSEADSGSLTCFTFQSDIGVALGSPTEVTAPPLPGRPPPPLPSPRARAATLPPKQLFDDTEQGNDRRKSEIKRWRTVSRLFNGKKSQSDTAQPEHVRRPNTSAGEDESRHSIFRHGRWARRSGTFTAAPGVDAFEPVPQIPLALKSAHGTDMHDRPPPSSTSLDVSIPSAQFGRYSSLFAGAIQLLPSSDDEKPCASLTDEKQARQSILSRRHVGIENLTIKSPSVPDLHNRGTGSKASLRPTTILQRDATATAAAATPRIPVIKPSMAVGDDHSGSMPDRSMVNKAVRRSKSAGEFLSLGTKVLAAPAKDMPSPARSLTMRTPRTPPLEAFFTRVPPPPSATEMSTYTTPQERWQESDDGNDSDDSDLVARRRKSRILDDSYAYLTATGGLSHHSDISSALLSFAHNQGQLSLDTSSQTISRNGGAGSLASPEPDTGNIPSSGFLSASYAPLTSPLPNSPLSFLSARSSPSRAGGGATPRLMRHGYDTPTTPCVATAQEMHVTSVRTARTYAQSANGFRGSPTDKPKNACVSELDSSQNSPQLSMDFDMYYSDSESESDDGRTSEEAMGSLARNARVVTPDSDRRSFRASLNEHAYRSSMVADPFAAQEGLWREVGECWGVRGSRLGLGLES